MSDQVQEVRRPYFVLTIEDAEAEGHINAHFQFSPEPTGSSQAHLLGVGLLDDLQVRIGSPLLPPAQDTSADAPKILLPDPKKLVVV